MNQTDEIAVAQSLPHSGEWEHLDGQEPRVHHIAGYGHVEKLRKIADQLRALRSQRDKACVCPTCMLEAQIRDYLESEC